MATRANYIAHVAGRGSVAVQHRGDEKRLTYGKKKRSSQQICLQNELNAMTDEELREVSLEKAPNRCATEKALLAQKLLYQRRNGYIARVV